MTKTTGSDALPCRSSPGSAASSRTRAGRRTWVQPSRRPRRSRWRFRPLAHGRQPPGVGRWEHDRLRLDCVPSRLCASTVNESIGPDDLLVRPVYDQALETPARAGVGRALRRDRGRLGIAALAQLTAGTQWSVAPATTDPAPALSRSRDSPGLRGPRQMRASCPRAHRCQPY